jgi:hypothetical protein
MTSYLIRRLFQMVIVTFFVAVATFMLFNLAPRSLPGQGTQIRMTQEDLARIRAQFELDLYWPVRFSRWLIGVPSGPLVIGGQEWFSNVPVGCYLPNEQTGQCDRYVYLGNIQQYHPPVLSSRGVLRGDFGLSTVLRPGTPVINEITARLRAGVDAQRTGVVVDHWGSRWHLQRGAPIFKVRLFLHHAGLYWLLYAGLLFWPVVDPNLFRYAGLPAGSISVDSPAAVGVAHCCAPV